MTEKIKYNNSFPKSERICSVKEIEYLFKHGQAALSYPVKMVFLKTESQIVNKAGFSVAKKRFKSAVKRNCIKRLMREAYRLNKHLLDDENCRFNCFFIYIGNQIADYKTVEKAIVKLIERAKPHLE